MPHLYKPPGHPAEDSHEIPPKRPRKQRLLLWISILFNVLSFVVILNHSHGFTDIFSHPVFTGDRWRTGVDKSSESAKLSDNNSKRCPSSPHPSASPPAPINIWASLTPSETANIQAWLRAPERNLNLTQYKGSALSDNVIFLIETYYPPKQDALTYLEDPKHKPRPARSARVTIHHGGFKDPFIKDYLVGPLPIGPRTKIRPLVDIYHRKTIPFNAYGIAQLADLPKFVAREVSPIASAMEVRTALLSVSHLLISSLQGTIWR